MSTERTNHLGQPIGPSVGDWAPPPAPARKPFEGRYCRLEPLDPSTHVAPLYQAYAEDRDGRGWTYLAHGPYEDLAGYRAWVEAAARGSDPLYFAVAPRETGRAAGVASYLRIQPSAGSIEVGSIHFSPELQRTPASTEAMFLMMERTFDMGYRRYEWKCDALNAASRAAAQRLGFSYEGVFRQATVYKGRNRDTAWYAVIDREWPALREAFRRWLAPENFAPDGTQRLRLSQLTGPLLQARG